MIRRVRIEFAPEIVDDFDRIIEHLQECDLPDVAPRVLDIVRAIDVLERNPLIGRLAENDNRELVIGRDARGYVALYRFIPELDTVFVLAIRGQKEAGYAHD